MENLKKIFDEIPQNQWNRQIRKNLTAKKELSDLYPMTAVLNEQLYLLMNNLTQPPQCVVDGCEHTANWVNNHYTQTCSYSCAQKFRKQSGKLRTSLDKARNTNREKYGYENPGQNPNSIIKRQATMMAKYGQLASPQAIESARARAEQLNIKGRRTIQEKYGVSHPSQITGHYEKLKKSLQQNWGVDHPSQIPHVKSQKQAVREKRFTHLMNQQVEILNWLEPSQELKENHTNPNMRIHFRCLTCLNEDTLASETYKFRIGEFGSPCKICTGVGTASSGQETQLREFVQSLEANIVANDRKTIAPFELDIFIPHKNLAIEYCGLFWHKEKSPEDKLRHLKKMNLCEAQGIRLITIFEDEWVNNQQLVQSRLINLLGHNTRSIGARHLTCQPISSKIANKFCNSHHIQGAGRTRVSLGLYYDQELMSVMTFSKLNIAKGSKGQNDVWELNRFCSLPNLNISGGASKLFQNFIKNHHPQQVISYSDRRWNSGNVYNQLGFDFIGHTSPSYWYIDFSQMKRLHRFGLRKNQDDDTNLTEWENRKNQGWDRIWDCGHSKWTWVNKKAGQ